MSIGARASESKELSVDARMPKRYVFSANDHNGNHYLSRLDQLLKTKVSHTIPFRAHDVLCLNNNSIIGFGRRPGFFCTKVNFETGASQTIEAAEGRHFYGHGCLSADDSLLFTTENNFDKVQGVIGVRDASTLKPLGEFSSFGIGPHDIHLMPDNKTLVVANGGIQTHPDFGRRKLNLKTMQPSLVYIDVATGNKLGEYRLDDHLLSIRHITLTVQGDVGVAMQYQGDIYRQQPQALVAWQSKNGELVPFNVANDIIESCHGYMADLAYDPELQLLAATSPRGNCLMVWDITTQRYCYAVDVLEVSGIQFSKQQKVFLVSTAEGQLLSIRAMRDRAQISVVAQYEMIKWDNHLVLGPGVN